MFRSKAPLPLIVGEQRAAIAAPQLIGGGCRHFACEECNAKSRQERWQSKRGRTRSAPLPGTP
jgi:hypothetical protein